jgi:hypothetical protein
MKENDEEGEEGVVNDYQLEGAEAALKMRDTLRDIVKDQALAHVFLYSMFSRVIILAAAEFSSTGPV